MSHGLPQSAVERFTKKLAPPNEEGCTLWLGGKINGYGVFHISGSVAKQSQVWDYAHRVSWRLKHDSEIPKGKRIRITCKNRDCCEHVELEVARAKKGVI
jgi:hypothetical protein